MVWVIAGFSILTALCFAGCVYSNMSTHEDPAGVIVYGLGMGLFGIVDAVLIIVWLVAM